MSKKYTLPLDYIQPDIRKWKLYELTSDKTDFLNEVVNRIVELYRVKCPKAKQLYDELASTLYQEKIRVSHSRWKSDPEDEKDYWNKIKGQLIKFQKYQSWSEQDREEMEVILRSILNRYAYEIVGNFNPQVFRTAQRFLPGILYSFLNLRKFSPFKFFSSQTKSFYKSFIIKGDLDKIRKLSEIGTIVVVPTHFCNTDSPIVGWTVNSIGLEAMTYGAGINLFGTQPLSYLMNNLGAYKIDRRRKNSIYLDILRMYSQVAIEKGTPSIFFPGGTRSRSGSIETKLKLGLLSTSVEAQQENFLKQGKKIFVLPLVINYLYNIEASSLINQYLTQEGREKYVAENMEYSTTYKIIRFIKQLFSMNTEMVMSFGEPMDVLGLQVDENGQSLSEQGKIIDIRGYFELENEIVRDQQRNYEYTKILGDRIIDSYFKHNVVMTSPLVAFVYFELLQRQYKNLSVFDLILLPKDERIVSVQDMLTGLDNVIIRLKQLEEEGRILLSKKIEKGHADKILKNGIDNISIFNSKNVLYYDSEGNINSEDVRLAYFYHNRLNGYQLEDVV